MKVASIVSTIIFVLAGLSSVVEAATSPRALSFAFEFDSTADSDSTVTPPIVGTGTFSFDSDPGPGTFALTSLPNFSFLFNFGSESFTNADISTPLANILVGITVVGSNYSVNFGGSGGGTYGGSLDFVNSSSNGEGLSFQPDFGSSYFTASNNVLGTFQGLTSSISISPVLSNFEGKSIGLTCSVEDPLSLMCSATTDVVYSGGVLKTTLGSGSCSAGTPATVDGSNKTVSLKPESAVCKNAGVCAFVHCFRADYVANGIGVLANMTEVNSTITYTSNGTFNVEIATSDFVATDSLAEATVASTVSARLGACDSNSSDTSALSIGETAAVCIFAEGNVKLNLTSVSANPGAQTLIDDNGEANFVTEVSDEGTNQVTLETLMVPAYYDAAGGNASSISITGTALITYTSRRRSLSAAGDEHGGRVLQGGVTEDSFTLEVPLVQTKTPEVAAHDVYVEEESSALVGSMMTALGAGFILTFFL